jgi:hypothetical protein
MDIFTGMKKGSKMIAGTPSNPPSNKIWPPSPERRTERYE